MQPISLGVKGQPGDVAWLAIAAAPGHALAPLAQGVVTFQPPAMRVKLGTIDASGILAGQILVPELGPGLLSRVMHAQLVTVDAAGGTWYGTPAVLTMLDSSL
jgi:hypothetical protein